MQVVVVALLLEPIIRFQINNFYFIYARMHEQCEWALNYNGSSIATFRDNVYIMHIDMNCNFDLKFASQC